MARIIAIDYGTKRTGLAVTDPMQIIATVLDTVPSHTVIDFLKNYCENEPVELIVLGYPTNMKNEPSSSATHVEAFKKNLAKQIPNIPVEYFDERFTSKMAFQAMIDSGIGKKRRQDKALVDKLSANLILQSYLEYRKNKYV